MTKVNVTFIKEITPPATKYKLGTFFIDRSNDIYILAMVDYDKACLVSLRDGNRFHNAVDISFSDGMYVTDEEFQKITSDQVNRFVEIENIDIKVY